jgi:SAM-dependent methyltransferase
MLPGMVERRFDDAYYARHYGDPDTRAQSTTSIERLVRFVCAYLDYLRVDVREVIDFGCGVGLWQQPLARAWPGVDYVGVEASEHACERYGWTHGSVVDYEHGRAVDLVVCQGVLQYLPAREAERAIRNLARHTGAALYLEALTQADWDHVCDQSRTDGDVYLRTGEWYRRILDQRFVSCGGGLFLPKHSSVPLFELERT